MEIKKIIYAVDGIVLVGSLFVIILMIGYIQPMVIAPVSNLETSESVLFSIDRAERILIDSNMEFSNPRVFSVGEGLEINLDPGEYYWKAEGIVGMKTEIRRLTILSKIDLRLREIKEGYEVINIGNVDLNVEMYNQSEYLGSFKLNSNQEKEVLGDKFVGRQDG